MRASYLGISNRKTRALNRIERRKEMPIGVVSDADILKELTNVKGQVPNSLLIPKSEKSEVEILPTPEKGRGLGTKNVEPEVRAEIAKGALLGISHKELMRDFGVSQSAVSAYVDNKTSLSAQTEDKKLKDEVESFRGNITKRAYQKLTDALDVISPFSLSELKPTQAAQVASSMSQIIRNVANPDDENKGNNTKILIYSPRIKEEEDYQVIDVRASEA
jgi:predicted transcriptional regulator